MKNKKWFKYTLYTFLLILAGLTLYGLSLYWRRDSLLQYYIEKEVSAKNPSLGFKLESASFVEGKGIQLDSIQTGTGPEPDYEIKELFIECDLSLRKLSKGEIKPSRLVIKGLKLRLKSKKMLKGVHLKLKETVSDKIGTNACLVELTEFQFICLPDSKNQKEPLTSSKIDIKIYPPETKEVRGAKNKEWLLQGKTDNPNVYPSQFEGEISPKFDDWLRQTLN